VRRAFEVGYHASMPRKIRLAAPLLLLLAALVPLARGESTPPAASAPPAPDRPPSLPKGQLIPKVDCPAAPGESYALYIPTSYDPARRSPIVYALDARRRGEVPARLFLPGAEKYGYLVASSYNSASDGPLKPTVDAMQAMWNDTHRRFAIDDRRVYAAGFSGTARAACFMGLAIPGRLTGVIAAGAGFPPDRPPTQATSFLYFATVGNLDFNYDEVEELAGRLAELHLPHRVEGFAGPHQWMPEKLATEALAWLDLRAMKAGTRGKDPAEIENLWQEDLSRARGFAAAGDPIAAFRLYSAMAEDYAGLRPATDLGEAAKQTAEIGGSKALLAAQKEREARRKRDRHQLAEAMQTLAAVPENREILPSGRVIGNLRLPELKARAAPEKGESDEALSARRTLAALYAQTALYLPQQALDRKDYRLAAFYVEIAAEIHPESPGPWYSLASVHAQAGEKKKALEELRKAAELGWSDPAQLESDADLAPLHGEPGWGEIVERVRKRAATPGPS
jgi:predicted esterase